MRRILGVATIVLLTGGIVLAPAEESDAQSQTAAVSEVRQDRQPEFLKRIRFAPTRRAAIDGPSDEEAIRIAMERGAELRRQREAGLLVPTATETEIEKAAVAEPAAPLSGWEVTGTRVNLRAGPGIGHPVVGQAALGERMEPMGDTGDEWIRVRRADGQEAWIFAQFLSPANG